MQPHRFLQSEHQIHVVECLPTSTFQQIVYHRYNQQFVFILLQVNETLVGVDHLLQVRIFIDDERK